ncbi:hypothetical protein P7C70_g1258, partial [Phenoliferia sp. Uapishka_3]
MNSSSASKRTLIDSDFLDDDSDEGYSPAPKKARAPKKAAAPTKRKVLAPVSTGPNIATILSYTHDHLVACSQPTLVETVVALQAEVERLQQSVVAAQSEAPVLSAEQIAKAADVQVCSTDQNKEADGQRYQQANGMETYFFTILALTPVQILIDPLFAASAKTGSAKFSHVLQLPRPVFMTLLSLPKTFKKAGKLTLDEFSTACGSYGLPEGKVRYDVLGITGGT